MMPKPMDSEKKIWPYAAAHTAGSARVDQSGAKRASSPWAAPGSVRACTTRAAKATMSTGMKMTDVAPTPRLTPRAITATSATQTTASGTRTPGTNSSVTPGSPARR